MEITGKLILTSILVVFKVAVILNFIIKFRKTKKRVKELEIENQRLKLENSKYLNKIA